MPLIAFPIFLIPSAIVSTTDFSSCTSSRLAVSIADSLDAALDDFVGSFVLAWIVGRSLL